MFCTKCGKELKEGVKFCTNCGAAIKSKYIIPETKEEKPKIKIGPFSGQKQIRSEASFDEMDKIYAEKKEGFENVQDMTVLETQEGDYADKTKKNGGLMAIILTLALLIIGVSIVAFWSLHRKDTTDDVIGMTTTDDSESTETNDQGPIFDDKTKESDDTQNTEGDKVIIIKEPAKKENEYILKNSDIKYLTKADLKGLTAEQCRLARNELYARHGRLFEDEELQNYFDSCSWYHGSIAVSDFDESMLSDIEIANRNLIVNFENEMGYR